MEQWLNDWSREWHSQALKTAETIFHSDLAYNRMSSNPNVTWSLISETLQWPLPWHLYAIQAENPNITWNVVQSHSFNWDYDMLSFNPAISLSIIRANPQYKWDYLTVEARDPLTSWRKLATESKHRKCNLLWKTALNRNPNVWAIYSDAVVYDISLCCDTWELSSNPCTTWKEIDRLADTDIVCFHVFGANPNVTWENICSRSNLDWDRAYRATR